MEVLARFWLFQFYMPDPEISSDSFGDFASQMESLTYEAQQTQDEAIPSKVDSSAPNFARMLRPILLGIQALSRATEENSIRLQKFGEALSAQGELPRLLSDVRDTLQKKNAINQKLFDALHSELKGYKDGFLLDLMQKPMLLDLIGLFDELEKLSHQLADFAQVDNADGAVGNNPEATTLSINLDHNLGALLELLERMEVTKLEPSTGKRVDKVAHRAVKVELAESADEDGEIIESLKSGFTWKGRIFRPEEVTIRKFQPGSTPTQHRTEA